MAPHADPFALADGSDWGRTEEDVHDNDRRGYGRFRGETTRRGGRATQEDPPRVRQRPRGRRTRAAPRPDQWWQGDGSARCRRADLLRRPRRTPGPQWDGRWCLRGRL